MCCFFYSDQSAVRLAPIHTCWLISLHLRHSFVPMKHELWWIPAPYKSTIIVVVIVVIVIIIIILVLIIILAWPLGCKHCCNFTDNWISVWGNQVDCYVT
jgi:hypothetical protein